MILNFIFSHLNLITLIIWLLFILFFILRFYRPNWFNNISYFKLILIAILLNLLYGFFVTWGQYYVWQNGSDLTRFLASSPISSNVPFPIYLEWVRDVIFGGKHGYFLYYILGRIWLNIFISFVISGILYLFLKIWNNHKGNFLREGPEIFLILGLVVGWPKIILLITFGFVIALILSIIYKTFGKKEILIEPIFIIITPIILIFEGILFNFIGNIF